jgi:hypothetical protein
LDLFPVFVFDRQPQSFLPELLASPLPPRLISQMSCRLSSSFIVPFLVVSHRR